MKTRSQLDLKFIAAIERLGRALRVARQTIATKHKISLLQLQLLERLSDGIPRRVGELANEIDVTQPTASDALRVLNKKGLVERQPDETDRRASVLVLTGTGKKLAKALANDLSPLLAAERKTSSEEQAIALRVVLEEITRLQENGVITINRSCLTCQHYRPPGRSTTAHCELLGEKLQAADLRVDCPDHVNAI